MKYSIFNGKLIKTKKANISLLDKGYWFDFCVYTSVKIIQSKPYFLEYHIDRLLNSAKILEIEHNFNKQEILDWTLRLIKKNKIQDALLRFVLIGEPDLGKVKAKLFILPITGLTYYKNKDYSEGIKVITFEGERFLPNAKSKSLLLSFLAYRKAKKDNAHEALMVDSKGCIREGTQTNFFAIKENKLIVPFKEKTLEGITKKFILDAVKNNFEITEEDIFLSKIKSGYYDECFISSTTRNVMPIREIDDYKFDSIEKCKKIESIFKKYIKENNIGD